MSYIYTYRYTPVKLGPALDTLPLVCSFEVGERMALTWEHIIYLSATQVPLCNVRLCYMERVALTWAHIVYLSATQVSIHICMYVCIYDIYLYIHTYIYIYIYI